MRVYVVLLVFSLVAGCRCALEGGVTCEASQGFFCNPTQRDCINEREDQLVSQRASHCTACTCVVTLTDHVLACGLRAYTLRSLI